MQLNRLFFALWPPEAIRSPCREVARQLAIRLHPGGRFVSAERYHMTLLFLGDQVPAEREAAALRAAAEVRSPPFHLRLDQAGSFRNNRSLPWWLGSREPQPALTLLYERLREAMLRAGVPPERMKFSPHLTVVRDAQRALPPTPVQAIDWAVEEFVLIRSRLDLQPPTYEILGRWPLDPEAPTAPAPDVARPQLDLGF